MSSRLLSLAVLASLAGVSAAQTVQVAPTTAPIPVTVNQHYTLDYATGELTKDEVATTQQVGTNAVSTLAYDNSCTSGFFSTVTPGAEFLDWGTKSAGLSTVVDSFTFLYGTFELDATAGGVGASAEIAFHSGTTGFGVTGTEVARFVFTGLPGATTAGTPVGFQITVDVSGGGEFCLPDGDVGYSICSNDALGTGPFLGDILACANGQDDAFDIYACPPAGSTLDAGTLVGTFAFMTANISTFVHSINEDDGSVLATYSEDLCSTATNPDLLSAGGVTPVLGTAWPLMVTEDAFPTSNAGPNALSVAAFYSSRFPCGTLILPAYGEVLIDVTSSQILVQTVAGAGGSFDHTLTVPKDVTLIGVGAAVQSVQIGGGSPISLSTLVEITVGF